MSIAEKVQQLEVDRDSLHRSYQGKVDELKYVREQFDKHKADFGHLPREVQRLTADRDQWKARAEKAEDLVDSFKGDVHYLKKCRGEWEAKANAAEKRVKELDSQRVAAVKCIELQAARIAELQRQLSSLPSTLEEVLEEIYQPGTVGVDAIEPTVELMFQHKYAPAGGYFIGIDGQCKLRARTPREAADKLTELVCKKYPDSAFARRRREGEATERPIESNGDGVTRSYVSMPAKFLRAAEEYLLKKVQESRPTPEPAPNCSKTSNSSPSTDIVAELLERYPGEWRAYNAGGMYGRIAILSDSKTAYPADAYRLKDAVALAELVNRYRRIVEAVKENPRILADLDSDKLFAALRPLVREAKP